MFIKKTIIKGPAGTGKTTAGVEHLLELSARTYDGILVLVPQKTLAGPYYDAIRSQSGNPPDVMTIGSLSRNMVDLYWPLVSEDAGFAHPDLPPVFLNLETAQYFVARVVRPLFREGFFESVTINRNRVYTQILDNLNKAALNGYEHHAIGDRLKLAVVGDPEQFRIYQDSQIAAQRFRQFCLDHNLLDFSLQLEIFWRYLWPEGSLCREYLQDRYKHILVDNLEETTPIEHDILREWLPKIDSALLIYDTDAGYRTFLGADPASAYRLIEYCDQEIIFDQSYVTLPNLEEVAYRFGLALKKDVKEPQSRSKSFNIQDTLIVDRKRYFPEMLDWVTENVVDLIAHQGVSPGEIVVLSPFLSDALRFSLSEKLNRLGIPTRSHRPSRSLRDEPVSQALLTLAMLAYPDWGLLPTSFDLAYMFIQAIDGMDLVRAQLLSEQIYKFEDGVLKLASFGTIKPLFQERISYVLGERYEHLRNWLENYRQGGEEELDIFLGRIFGEVISQPGYGFHTQLSAGETAANLIDSIRNFRWITGSDLVLDKPLGKEYIEMVQEGVVAAQYIRSWQIEDEDSVLLAPAYTFLMRNRAVEYQFWLDIASHGWNERIYQPLTHPYVLNRNWPKDRFWTDIDEVETNHEALYRLIIGLIRRCKHKIYLGLSELSESGYENDGLLLRTLQRVYQQVRQAPRRSD